MRKAEVILTHFGIRTTAVRLLLLNEILHAEAAQSLSDLEVELRTVDKSSISRNLNLFLEAGIIHRIEDGTGVSKYALSQDEEGEWMADTNHAHFFCRKCQETICLDDLTLDLAALNLPEGFTADSYNLVLKGSCSSCR